jgi:hypothetical protein
MDCEFETTCRGSKVIGFDFCGPHLSTPRGQQHALERIKSGVLFTEQDLEQEIQRRAEVPDKDYHTSALEKMDKILGEIIGFQEHTKKMLFDLDPSDWRYSHKTSGEQTRMEVGLYERAQDRAARVLKDVSKMALEEKIVSLGRAQTELIIRILMAVVMRMGLDAEGVSKARALLLDEFQREANLSSRLEKRVTEELEAPVVING